MRVTRRRAKVIAYQLLSRTEYERIIIRMMEDKEAQRTKAERDAEEKLHAFYRKPE
jgi:hypothetical protein